MKLKSPFSYKEDCIEKGNVLVIDDDVFVLIWQISELKCSRPVLGTYSSSENITTKRTNFILYYNPCHYTAL